MSFKTLKPPKGTDVANILPENIWISTKDNRTFATIRIVFFILKNLNMNKGELIDSIASKSGLTKADATKALDATLETITNELKKGERVTLPGFGTFSTSERSARTGRNPQTGKEIQIAAKTVAKFKAGKNLADAVN